MSIDVNKETVRELFEAMDNGNYSELRAMLAPNFVCRLAGNVVARLAGNDDAMDSVAFLDLLKMLETSFADSRHIIESQVAEGEEVVTRIVWTAIHVAEFNGIAASHNPVTVEAMATDRVINGKIVEHWGLSDLMTLMMQIGEEPSRA